MRGTDITLGSIQTSLEVMEDPVIVTTSTLDPPGPSIVFVNAAFCRVSGYAPDEILGKTLRLLQSSSTSPAILRRLRRDLKTKQVFFGDMVNRRKDGSEFTVKCQIVPIHDDAGAVRYWLSIQRDVTDLNGTERDGRTAEDRYYQSLDITINPEHMSAQGNRVKELVTRR